jgi:hypothetical protein
MSPKHVVRHGMPFVMSQGALGPLVSDNGLNSLMLFENGIISIFCQGAMSNIVRILKLQYCVNYSKKVVLNSELKGSLAALSIALSPVTIAYAITMNIVSFLRLNQTL